MSIYQRIRRGMPPTIVLLLSLLVLRIDAALQQHSPTSPSLLSSSSRNYQVAQEILEGLQQQQQQIQSLSSSAKQQQQQHLDLETDFYDDSTGLYSEGVWHNCMAGIAALQLNRRSRSRSRSRNSRHHATTTTTTQPNPSSQERYDNNDHADADDAITRISDSLFRYSWDGISFRRRTWSGNWDHSRLQLADTDVVQSNYYKESSEHRCIQHGIALVFWSMLANKKDNNNNDETGNGNNSNTSNDISKNNIIRSQQSLIAKQFLNEYWNGKRWTTIGRSQGSGTTFRPSASSGTIARTDQTTTEDDDAPLYFRAVDQAVAIVACLHHIELLDNTMATSDGGHGEEEEERERFDTIIRMTCRDLLDEKDGFGYNNLSTSRTYLGLNRNRNFWHEGWVMLALTLARDYVWPMDAQEGHLRILWDGLMERYTTKPTTTTTTTTTADTIRGKGDVDDVDDVDATIWHYRLSEKDVQSNVRYCGDNALAFAIRRNLQCRHQSTIEGEFGTNEGDDGNTDDNDDDDDAAFWKFIDMLRSGNEEGSGGGGDDGGNAYHLASVADLYPQVRLHPNTELAALLVWPP